MQKLVEALNNADISVPNKNIETFKIVRWGRNNRYWLKKFEGGYVFGDFVRGISSHVFEEEFKGKRLQEAHERMQNAIRVAELKSAKMYEQASDKARHVWSCSQTSQYHEYLARKKVASYGLREYKSCLVVPACDKEGIIWTLQFINSNGEKRFLCGGKKKGCFFPIGSLKDAEKIFICEGYATGATIHECSGNPVVVAFDSGNLKYVAQAIFEKYPATQIIICADNDCYHENGVNSGIEKAEEAANLSEALVIVPKFKDVATHPTDFNDLFVLEGKEAVQAQLKEALQQPKTNGMPTSDTLDSFILHDDGLFFIDKKTEKLLRISNYIKVIAFTKSADEISRLVEFRDYKGDMQTTILKPKMFTRDGDQMRMHLMQKGFIFAGSLIAKRKLFEYILSSVSPREVNLVSRTGFLDDIYVRPDQVIGAVREDVVFDAGVRDDSYAVSKTLQLWNDMVARWCMGNSRLIFAISAGFASLLLKVCDMPNVGFHFVGNSSSGKTTCLNVAASVFGNPKYVVTWKATDNALENIAFRRNDSLLILDELSEISPSKAGDVAYMLANGEGKKRLDKNCNARETFSWRLIFLSSGEVDLTSHMAEENRNSKAGQKVRLLNISANPSKYSCGIFENLMGFQDGAEFSGFLRENASKYYGTASIAFINQVLKHQNIIKEMYKEEFQRLKSQYLPEDASGQDLRAFEHFMFVGFAGELAIKWGVVCWKSGTACCAAVDCFNSWLEDKDGVGDDENRQILEHVKSFFELHSHSRFYELGSYSDQKISNMAGYRKTFEDGFNFYVSTSVFQNEICKGFRRKSVIALLLEKGLLLKDFNGEYRQQKWTPDGNKKVYVISGKILA